MRMRGAFMRSFPIPHEGATLKSLTMAAELNSEFDTVHSGASDTFPAQCSSLRKSGHVMIKSHPCKIMEMTTSKTGKHGHAKVHLVGIDIFTGKKYEDICPSTHNMNVPNVKRTDFQIVDIEEGFLSLMDDAGEIRSDIKVPDNDIGKEIQTRFDNSEQFMVTVLKACGQELAVATKNLTIK